MCNDISEMMNRFKTSKKYEEVHDMIVKINEQEGNGDVLYQNAIRELYSNEKDPIEILKWHRIYQSAERFYDSCESVANTMREVILKNM